MPASAALLTWLPPDGVPNANFGNVGAGFRDGLPHQPWADELVKKRMAGNNKDNPDAHCLPMGFMQFHTHRQPRKIIHTPGVTNLGQPSTLSFSKTSPRFAEKLQVKNLSASKRLAVTLQEFRGASLEFPCVPHFTAWKAVRRWPLRRR